MCKKLVDFAEKCVSECRVGYGRESQTDYSNSCKMDEAQYEVEQTLETMLFHEVRYSSLIDLYDDRILIYYGKE